MGGEGVRFAAMMEPLVVRIRKAQIMAAADKIIDNNSQLTSVAR